LLQIKLHDIELSVRGTLRGFGLKVGKTTPKTFESRVRSLVADHPTLLAITDALLRARAVLAEQFRALDNQAHRAARADKRARLLATAPGVGSIVALTYAAAIDDPSRFKSSKSVGPLFGLTPRRYQSGETDVTGRISKAGDAMDAPRFTKPPTQFWSARQWTRRCGRGPWRWPAARGCARPKWRWHASWR
jgi:transposase